MKQSFYFPHDYEPTSDPKIQALVGEQGALGYGIFWRVVEMLHSDSTHKLPLKEYLFVAIGKQMSVDPSIVKALLEHCLSRYELFKSDNEFFWSDRVNRNICEQESKKLKKSEAGRLGGISTQSRKRSNAKALLKQSEAKEKKRKEIKEEEITQSPSAPKSTHNDKENTKEQKTRYLEFVLLTPTEYQKLLEQFGDVKLGQFIRRLNDYIGSKGASYKSHYYTILNWERKDKESSAAPVHMVPLKDQFSNIPFL